MSQSFIIVSNGISQYEIDLEDDSSVLQSTINSAFGLSSVCGLSYVNTETKNERIVPCLGEKILEPKSGWQDRLYKIISQSKVDNEECDARKPPSIIENCIQQPLSANEGQTSISKTKLIKACSSSGIARAALYQWNKLNTTVRRLVHASKFHGSGGMSTCTGTSTTEAFENRGVRDYIVNHQDVKALFSVFTLSDTEKVILDASVATNHVSYVINDMKRKPKVVTEIRSVEAENTEGQIESTDKENVNSDEGHYLMESGPSSMVTPQKRSTNAAGSQDTCSSTPKRRKIMRVQDTKQMNKDKGKGNYKGKGKGKERILEEELNDTTQSEYELMRARNIEENRNIMRELGIGQGAVLNDSDAIVVAKFCLQKDGCKLQKDDIKLIAELNDLRPGIEVESKPLRLCLVELGRMMVEGGKVKLRKDKGLLMKDIEYNYD